MNICLIHQYFKTPETGGAIRSYYLASHLVKLGHTVTVITARNNRAYTIDKINGFDVHNLPVYYENHLNFWSRIHAFFLFVWKTNRLLKKLPKADLNYVITTPLTTGFIALKALKGYKTPYIFEVGDLWPEAPIQLGVIQNSYVIKWLRNFESKIYRHAQSMVALSPDIKDYIQKIVPDKKITVITNFADLDFFGERKGTINSPLASDLKDKFVITYMGTVGMANHLEYLIDLAKNTIDLPLAFVIMGAGARYEAIQRLAIDNALPNIHLLPHQDKNGVREVLALTDAVYISFKKVPVLSTGSPNKFFDGLAAGKLIIINFEGWIKKLIDENHCGFYYDPLQPERFREKIVPYISNQALLTEAQQHSKNLAFAFTPEQQLGPLPDVIKI